MYRFAQRQTQETGIYAVQDEFSKPGRYALAVILLLAGMWFGIKLPDIDQTMRLWPVLSHRSLLTHGLLIPLFLYWQLHKSRSQSGASDPLPRLALMGFLMGISAHLAFDLFPYRWWGFARIHVPVYGYVSPFLSQAWMFGSVLACLYGVCRLLRAVGEMYLSLAVLSISFVLCAQSHGSYAAAPFWAFLTLAFAASVAFMLPRPAIHKG